MQYFLVGKSDCTSSTLFSRQVHVLLLLLWVAFFWVCTLTQVHKLCTFTCLVYISFDGTERDGRCCGLGRPFCSDFSAVGDVLHFHFAQGYWLDVMYFVSTSESDTLILDMNHDGDWFPKETWWFIDWFTIMIHITKMSVWFTGTHYSRYITSSRYPWAKGKWRTSPTALTWKQKGRPRPQQRPSLSVPSKDTGSPCMTQNGT